MIICGVAGNIGKDSEESLKKIKELGLAQEIEFVRGIYMTKEQAKKLKPLTKNLKLSIHTPYYINLSSKEKIKISQSKRRIIKSCEIGHYLGAKNIVFHAGYYQGRDKEEVYQIIKNEVLDIKKQTKKFNITLCPETTGKESQFGELDELLRLKKETGCGICIDFAHLKARHQNKLSLNEILKKLKPLKGEIHCHYSGIEYSSKGERRHKLTDMKEFKQLAKEILKHKLKVTIINESPDPLGDALKMKEVVEKLK